MRMLIKRFAKWIIQKDVDLWQKEWHETHTKMSDYIIKLEEAIADDDTETLMQAQYNAETRRGKKMQMFWHKGVPIDFENANGWKAYTSKIDISFEYPKPN